MCSQCNEEFATGYEYRMHWEKHLEDYLKYGSYFRMRWSLQFQTLSLKLR